jgi:DNA-binding NtrC family response regulator
MTAPSTTAIQPAEAGSTRQPARILVVDDQAEVCEFLCQIIELIGHAGVSTTSAVHALSLLEEDAFDVVISDFKMPEMTGVEFHSAAADIRPEIASRFIFLTGDLFNPATEATIAALDVPALGKPFRIATVERTIGEVLAKNRSVA